MQILNQWKSRENLGMMTTPVPWKSYCSLLKCLLWSLEQRRPWTSPAHFEWQFSLWLRPLSTHSKSEKIEILKGAAGSEAFNDSNFQSDGSFFFSSSLPTDSMDQPMGVAHLAFPSSSIQSCPSFYRALENKARIYTFASPSFTLAGFQRPKKQSWGKGRKSQHFRKLLKWSWLNWWFLNAAELMGDWAGSPGTKESWVKEWGKRRASQPRVRTVSISQHQSASGSWRWK